MGSISWILSQRTADDVDDVDEDKISPYVGCLSLFGALPGQGESFDTFFLP